MQYVRDALNPSGIQVSFEGSLRYDVIVSEEKSAEAMGILRTNRLVAEQKLRLYEKPYRLRD